MKILSVVGTRPEIVKSLAFVRASAGRRGVTFELAFSGQNFVREMSTGIFAELGMVPKYSGTVDRSSPEAIGGSITDFVAKTSALSKPDVILSNTDTDTARYSALAGQRLGIPVAHLEGGIRCEAKDNPEEVNRRLADHAAKWIFAISDEDVANLRAEGITEGVHNFGDVTWDALKIVCSDHRIDPVPGDYDLLTFHRQENTGNSTRLIEIIDAVEGEGMRTVFPVHPRTLDALKRAGLWERVRSSRTIEARDPQQYLAMVRLLGGCRKLISDSGGLRREGYLLGKPVISLVDFVWFHQMSAQGFECRPGRGVAPLRKAIREFNPPVERPALFGDGNAAGRILDLLAKG